MPGAEWTNDEPGDRDHHSPPLSGPEAAPSYPFVPVAPFDQAHAQPPEPAMAHVPHTPDPEETEPTDTPAQPRKPLVSLAGLLAVLKKIPRPSLGSERHEMFLDVNRNHDEPHSAEHEPERIPAKFPFLPIKRETRIGLATLLSFGVLVTALVVQRYTRSPVLALSTPADEPTKEAKEKEEAKQKEEAKAKEDAKAKAGPAVVEATDPPQKLPVDPPVGKPQLAGDVKPKEPEVLPKSESPAVNSLPLLAEAASKPTTPPVSIPSEELELPTMAGAGAGAGTSPSPPASGAVAAANPAASEPVKLPSTTPTPAPKVLDDLPVIASDPKPALPVLNPDPASAVPPTVPVAAAAAPAEALPQVAPVTPEPVANPITSLNSVATSPTAPVPSTNTPPLDPVPPASPTPPPSVAPAPIEPAATPTSMGGMSTVAAPASTAALVGAGWLVVQSGGRRIPGTGTIVSTPADSELSQPSPSRVADRPRPSPAEDEADSDQIEPVFHKVKSGENFWTISKLYYNSNRYYKALHAANQKLVPDIAKLYVGTVLKIPPPEKLDRSLIERETAPVTRTTKKVDPGDLADLAPAVRPRPRPDAEAAVEAPRRPTYKVKARDTLRTIARDTLNDSTRDREIFDLNRDVLESPRTLPVGTILVLPEDASTGRVPR